jgi:ABC-type nickel/cobalt efflux system permease component RcnA
MGASWRIGVDEGERTTPVTTGPFGLVRNPIFAAMKHEHNHRHRRSALGYRTPAEYAAACRHTHTPVACEIY